LKEIKRKQGSHEEEEEEKEKYASIALLLFQAADRVDVGNLLIRDIWLRCLISTCSNINCHIVYIIVFFLNVILFW